MYIDFKKYNLALNLSQSGVKKFGKNSQLYNILSRAYFGKKYYKKSVKFALMAKNLDPDDYEPVYLEGLYHLSQGEYSKAEFLFEWAINLRSNVKEVIYHLALAQRYSGEKFLKSGKKKKAQEKFDSALKNLSQLLSIDPTYLDSKSLKSYIDKKKQELE
jgi:tetratricopeptide (TPR) repeat protein